LVRASISRAEQSVGKLSPKTSNVSTSDVTVSDAVFATKGIVGL